MQIRRAAAVPLIVHDPYFSIWSAADRLNAADPVHWSGVRQAIRASIHVNGKDYGFMGNAPASLKADQISLKVTATSTEYVFVAGNIAFELKFTSPLLLRDPVLVSRPCTYVSVGLVENNGGVPEDLEVRFEVLRDVVSREDARLNGFSGVYGAEAPFSYAMMGRAFQKPLGDSSDNTPIDWGYVYLASESEGAQAAFDPATSSLVLTAPLAKGKAFSGVIAYDDLIAVNYFGDFKKALWTERYATILDAIEGAFSDRQATLAAADAVDKEIEGAAAAAGGEDYAFLAVMSYRHAIAAHKLIRDEKGELIFLSRENDSNSCIGTVDISYPSVPLFLLYNTDYVKGMLRPVFRFAAMPVWPFDFAPHDVGRYPYAWGQVYGLKRNFGLYSGEQGTVCPPLYQFADGKEIFEHYMQMPVEESGNMLIMTAAVCILDGSADFALPYFDILKGWTEYLLTYGEDPGEQLCTDDFAGHLAHNVNLSIKAIMGIEAFAKLNAMKGDQDAAREYHEKAAAMTKSVLARSDSGDHFALTFDKAESWSLKYNAVWDQIFESGLFPEDFFEKEIAKYQRMENDFGVPLDSRATYTKSDWILWCVAMTQDKDARKALIRPVARYLRETKTRYPFSDWYDTVSGDYCHFKGRSVQGGIYMPILLDQLR